MPTLVDTLEAFRDGCEEGLSEVLSTPRRLQAFRIGWDEGVSEVLGDEHQWTKGEHGLFTGSTSSGGGVSPTTVFYHGTKHSFTAFSHEAQKDRPSGAFMFTPHKNVAENYSAIEGPPSSGHPQVVAVNLDLKNPKAMGSEEISTITKEMAAELKAQGHDGVITYESADRSTSTPPRKKGDIHEVGVFDPEQVHIVGVEVATPEQAKERWRQHGWDAGQWTKGEHGLFTGSTPSGKAEPLAPGVKEPAVLLVPVTPRFRHYNSASAALGVLDEPVQVLLNPSYNDVLRFARHLKDDPSGWWLGSESGYIRTLTDTNTNVYAWSAGKVLHDEMQDALRASGHLKDVEVAAEEVWFAKGRRLQSVSGNPVLLPVISEHTSLWRAQETERRMRLRQMRGDARQWTRGEGGRFTGSEPGGGEQETVTVFHGTVTEVVDQIKQAGIRINPGQVARLGDSAVLYKDDRGRSVFVSETEDAAHTWADMRSLHYGKIGEDWRSESVVFKVEVPKAEWAKFKSDKYGRTHEGWPFSKSYYAPIDIPPQWVKSVITYKQDPRTYDPAIRTETKLRDVAYDKETIYLAIVVADAPSVEDAEHLWTVGEHHLFTGSLPSAATMEAATEAAARNSVAEGSARASAAGWKPLPGSVGHPLLIATRKVTLKNIVEAPGYQEQYTRPDVASMRLDPERFAAHMDLLKNPAFYPNFKPQDFAGKSPDQVARMAVDHIKSNMRFMYGLSAGKEEDKVWYDGARLIVDRRSKRYGYVDASVAGVYAGLSPQKDWDINVHIGDQLIRIYHDQQQTRWDTNTPLGVAMNATAARIWKPKDRALVNSIRGKTLGELTTSTEKAMWIRTYDEATSSRNYRVVLPNGNFGELARNEPKKGQTIGDLATAAWNTTPNIARAVRALEANGDRDKISEAMGDRHKMRSFYNNILDPHSPNGDVTSDTHHFGVGLLRDLGGSSGPVMHGFGNGLDSNQQAAAKAEWERVSGLKTGAEWVGTTATKEFGLYGLYPLYADATRELAAELKIEPRQLQSIVWVEKRKLFGGLTDRQHDDIERAWKVYRNSSTITQARTQQRILRIVRGR